MADIVTPKNIYDDFTENILAGEDLGATAVYQLMEKAKNILEDELKLQILQSVNTDKVATVGGTYLTMYDLPDDWRSTDKIVVGNVTYYPIRFVQREAYKNVARKYYINPRTKQFALCGTITSADTITHFYHTTTPIISESNENSADTIIWPDRFKACLPFKMGLVYQSTGQGDATAYRLSPGNASAYEDHLDAFIAWDQDLKLQDLNGALGYADSQLEDGIPFDVGSM